MATTVYGAWQGAAATGKVTHRAYLTYTVTVNSADTYTINVSASGIDPWNSTWSGVTVDYTWGATGVTTGTGQRSVTVSSSDPYALVGSRNYTYSKTHAAQSKTVFATTTLNHVVSSAGGSSVNGKTSTASVTFSVPARTSYSVTFNANGGSGAPGAQTKWYNEALALSSTRPTRANYTFKGWATSEARATSKYVDYAAGGTVAAGTNSALSLWAVWDEIYVPASVTNLVAFRTADETTTPAEEDDEGTYLYVGFDYICGHYQGDTLPEPATTCTITLDGTTLDTLQFSDSDSFDNESSRYSVSAFSTGISHSLIVTLSNSVGTVTYTYTVPSTKYPIEIEADASIMALGTPIRLKRDMYMDIDEAAASGMDYQMRTALTALGWWKPISQGGVLMDE